MLIYFYQKMIIFYYHYLIFHYLLILLIVNIIINMGYSRLRDTHNRFFNHISLGIFKKFYNI